MFYTESEIIVPIIKQFKKMKKQLLLILALAAASTLSAQRNHGLEFGVRTNFMASTEQQTGNGVVCGSIGWRFNDKISAGFSVGYMGGTVFFKEYDYQDGEYNYYTESYDIHTRKRYVSDNDAHFPIAVYLNAAIPFKNSNVKIGCNISSGFEFNNGQLWLQAIPCIVLPVNNHFDLQMGLGFSSITGSENYDYGENYGRSYSYNIGRITEDYHYAYPTFSASIIFH